MNTPVPGLPVGRGASSVILLRRYRERQSAIASQVAAAIVSLWNRVIKPEQFADSWATIDMLIQGIIDTHYDMSAAEAAQYYAMSRVVAGFPAVPVPGTVLAPGYLESVVHSMGAGQFFHFLKSEDPETASEKARDALSGAGTRMTLKGGRETITQAAVNDPVALGWERIITAGSCGFCSMLAGRGGVYKESTVGFRAHDHCHCVARPVFQGQKSVNAGLSEAWGEVTRGHRGAAARAEWDKYWRSHGDTIGPAAKEPTEARSGNAAVQQERVGQPTLPH